MEGFIAELIGGIVWLVANGAYVDARRKSTRGARRFFAFWLGFPLTWFWLLTVREGSQPRIAPPPDDEEALFAEVRRDRSLRGGRDEADVSFRGQDQEEQA